MVVEQQAPIEQSPLRLRDLPDPEPGPGELLIRVRACAVCHTDLHVVEGDLAPHKLPVIPGHQVVGAVQRLGESVEGFAVGDAVCVPWLYSTCGECRFCRRGQENLCEGARFTGWDVDGGFATAMVTKADFTYHIGADMDPLKAAPLLCAGVIGLRALRIAGAERAERLGLYGFGASAHIAIQIARHWGCEVSAFTRSEGHRRLALELGAKWAGDAGDEPPDRLDAAVIFAPAGGLVPVALRALDRGGTVACAGIHMSDIPQMPYESLYYERVLRSVANSTRQDVRDLLELAQKTLIKTQVTAFPLAEANEALRAVKESRIDGAAVLVME
jgi:propanol-preferring alcohol dehydrogenase